MIQDLKEKAFKFISASIGLLIAAYTVGWSGALTLHNLFKTERVEAQQFVVEKIQEAESKWNSIRQADLDGIHGKMDILIKQNNLIISQNYRTRKIIEDKK